ncbi:unnamed protein product [Urochloa humidicola]
MAAPAELEEGVVCRFATNLLRIRRGHMRAAGCGAPSPVAGLPRRRPCSGARGSGSGRGRRRSAGGERERGRRGRRDGEDSTRAVRCSVAEDGGGRGRRRSDGGEHEQGWRVWRGGEDSTRAACCSVAEDGRPHARQPPVGRPLSALQGLTLQPTSRRPGSRLHASARSSDTHPHRRNRRRQLRSGSGLEG